MGECCCYQVVNPVMFLEELPIRQTEMKDLVEDELFNKNLLKKENFIEFMQQYLIVQSLVTSRKKICEELWINYYNINSTDDNDFFIKFPLLLLCKYERESLAKNEEIIIQFLIDQGRLKSQDNEAYYIRVNDFSRLLGSYFSLISQQLEQSYSEYDSSYNPKNFTNYSSNDVVNSFFNNFFENNVDYKENDEVNIKTFLGKILKYLMNEINLIRESYLKYINDNKDKILNNNITMKGTVFVGGLD